MSKGLDRLSNSWSYLNNSTDFENEVMNATKYLLYKRNWKCVGSGVNYIAAKNAAISIIRKFNKSTGEIIDESLEQIASKIKEKSKILPWNIFRSHCIIVCIF